MKYSFAYKTSDGVRHEDSLEAASRDEVFEVLRGRGIRPIKVVAADGSKANGEVRGVKKRVVAGLVALAAIVAGGLAYLGGERTGAATASNPELSAPRHQIYGDPAVVSAFERGDFASVFVREGDRLLAIFAQPGKLMCAKGADPRRLTQAQLGAFSAYAEGELAAEKDLALGESDSREEKELKQIVNGIRAEMREYLANGNGSPRSFWRRLNERTLQEVQIYERTRRELENESSSDAWESKNDALRRLGLRTIPNPNE